MIVISCEHATNRVPADFAYLFDTPTGQQALQSHEGLDLGAAVLAGRMSEHLGIPFHRGEVTRLLLDLNRSPINPQRWSRFSAILSTDMRAHLHSIYFQPYFAALKSAIEAAIVETSFALHLSAHTFTRNFHGNVRSTDIGILFDPSRSTEATIANRWIDALRDALPEFKIDANRPYLGTDDGLTSLLRDLHPESKYSGIEIEVCSDLCAQKSDDWIQPLLATIPLEPRLTS